MRCCCLRDSGRMSYDIEDVDVRMDRVAPSSNQRADCAEAVSRIMKRDWDQ